MYKGFPVNETKTFANIFLRNFFSRNFAFFRENDAEFLQNEICNNFRKTKYMRDFPKKRNERNNERNAK